MHLRHRLLLPIDLGACGTSFNSNDCAALYNFSLDMLRQLLACDQNRRLRTPRLVFELPFG